ncbi:hypothetical protein [Crenobacter cavernae]|uniref:Uncharacterized protein n=1 Tax=Crenobacter cavernae TaxID=2290923 RepID=A0A345Y5Y7_9NEIS|nr:hypothetical protein [Crenobacter cavernae]AXK39339.1 hypothetical protein DWG20_07795 [Crenobacter cavernae]
MTAQAADARIAFAYVVGVAELTFVATQVNKREQVYPLEILAFIARLYLLLCGTLEALGCYSERRWATPGR